MKSSISKLLAGFSFVALLLVVSGPISVSAYAAAPTLTGSVTSAGMIQLKWDALPNGTKISSAADTGILSGYAVFLRKASDTDTSWNKKPFALLDLVTKNYDYYNLESMPSGTYVAQVAAYGYDVVGYHFDYYSNQVTVQVGSTVNAQSGLAATTYPQIFIPANGAGKSYPLSLTGVVKDCTLMYKWSTLPDTEKVEGYAVFLKNINDTDSNWSIKPFGLLRKSLNNYNYYNLSGMPYGTYVAKIAKYNYDVIGYQFNNYSNEVTLDFTCGTAPVKETLSAPTITAPYSQQYFTDYPRVATVQWTPVSGAVSYQVAIECDICGSSLWESKYPIYSTTSTSFVTPPLAGNNIFRVRVRAVGNASIGPWSDFRNFTFTTSTLDQQLKLLQETLQGQKASTPSQNNPSSSSNSSKSAVQNQDLYLTASVAQGGVSLNFGFQNTDAQEESVYEQYLIERYTLTKKNIKILSTKKTFLVDPDEDTYFDKSAVYGKKYSYRVYAVSYLANGKTKKLGSSSIVKLLNK